MTPMTRSRLPGRPARALTAITGLTMVALVATGCTSDDPDVSPSETTESSASPSPSASFEARDRSAEVLAAAFPAARGSAAGTVSGTPVTLNVGEVRTTSDGTILTYWFTGESTSVAYQGDGFWDNQPFLVDVAGEQIYEPTTLTTGRGTLCLCTDASLVSDTPHPRTVFYPALPETVTTVEVRQEGIDQPITVPVTR